MTVPDDGRRHEVAVAGTVSTAPTIFEKENVNGLYRYIYPPALFKLFHKLEGSSVNLVPLLLKKWM